MDNSEATTHQAITVRHSNRCAICGRITVKVNGKRVHRHEIEEAK